MSNTEKAVKDIRRKTRRKLSTDEKIRIVLDGLRGESSIAELCRKEGINPKLNTPGGAISPDDAGQDRALSLLNEECGEARALLLPVGIGKGHCRVGGSLQPRALSRVAGQRHTSRRV